MSEEAVFRALLNKTQRLLQQQPLSSRAVEVSLQLKHTHTQSARQQFGLVRLLASANFDGGVRHTVASVVECSTSAAAVVLCSFAGGGGVLSSASVSVSVSSKTGLASFAFLSPPHSLSVLSCQCTLLKVLLELQLSTQQKTPSEPFADCAKRPSLGGKAPQN